MKYIDKLVIIPECYYRTEDGNIYNSFIDAVINSRESAFFDKMCLIEIINPNASNIHPDEIKCNNLESKNLLCIYARNRFIYISFDKSEIYFERFELKRSISDNWICNFCYDYEYMYGNKCFKNKFNAFSNMYNSNYYAEISPISDNKKFISDISNKEALMKEYRNSGVNLQYICFDENDNDFELPLSSLLEKVEE